MRGKAACSFKNVRVDQFDAWLIAELPDKVLTREVVGTVWKQARDMGGQWARERRERREALVTQLRGAESRRSKLYGVPELLGTDAPNLADSGHG